MGMIGDIAEGIKAVRQIAARPLLAIAFASGALLYAPAHAITATGLADSLAKYWMWIGFALLASCAYLLAHGLAWVFNVVSLLLDDTRIRRVRREWLTTPTPNEKAALIPYIRDQAVSVTYSLNDGTVRGLEGKRALYRVSSVSYGLGFPFSI